MKNTEMSETYQGGLGNTATQRAWMRYADANEVPHDHEDEEPFKEGFGAGDAHGRKEVAALIGAERKAHDADLLELQEMQRALRRIEKMFTDASDDDAFTRNHGDGANLTSLSPKDIYILGRSTLLLNLMGHFSVIKADTLAAIMKEKI